MSSHTTTIVEKIVVRKTLKKIVAVVRKSCRPSLKLFWRFVENTFFCKNVKVVNKVLKRVNV